MYAQNLADVAAGSLEGLWWSFVSFIPNLLGALVVLVVGLIVAAGLGALVEKVFESLKLDTFLGKLGISHYFERAGMHLKGARFLGRLVYWFLVIAFFLAVADILGLDAVSGFLGDVLLYVPNVVVAALIVLASVVVGNVVRRVVMASVMSAKLHAAHFLGSLTWWAIVVFGFFAALSQLGIATSIVNALITGFIAMLAIAGGLAFGLGGRDYAAHLIAKLRESTEG